MKKFYKTKKFIEIQNKWYDKLKKSGFKDLEWIDPKTGLGQNTPYLLTEDSKLKDRYNPSEQTYYENALSYYHHGNFKSKLHKFIWKCHAEGISYRKMRKNIKSRGFKFVPSIFWISVEINKIRKDMALFLINNPEYKSGNSEESIENFIETNNSIF